MNKYWKNFVAVILFIVFQKNIHAQILSGLTHIPDTSFTNYSALMGAKKENPAVHFPEINVENIRIKKNVTYKKIDKRKLQLDVFEPVKKTDTLTTALIIIHGGGWRSGSKTQHHDMAKQLANLGYVCFTPEYRLSTEALFPAAVYDVKAVVKFVREQYNTYHIDTNKIVAIGFSAGGHLAALLATTGNMPLFEGEQKATKTSSNINALIDIDGTLSFVHNESSEITNRNDTSKKIKASAYWLGFSIAENYAMYQIASPLNYANAKTPPSLIINSSLARMHAGREDFIKILQQHNVYSQVKIFENSPHQFCLLEPWFTPTINCIDEFLRKVFN